MPRYPTRTPPRPARLFPLGRPWLSLLVLALLVKALLIGLTLFVYGAAPDPLTALVRAWTQWDAKSYLALAMHGYSAAGDARNLIAFFPLYPVVIHAIAIVGISPEIAALLISNVAGVVAAILLYAIARTEQDESSAWRAAAVFTVFPTAYFLFVGYTEALFCTLAFGSVLLCRRRRWLASGVLGGLAAATRLTGLVLVPATLVELWTRRRRLDALWRPLVGVALVLLGFIAYLVTNQMVLGSPFAFVGVQREHWSHALAPPWVGFANAIRSIGWRVPWEKVTVGGGEIAGGLACYATATLSWLRLRPADAAYATVLTILITFVPFWLSIPRYLLAMYPLFLLVGRITSRWLYLLILSVSSIGLAVFGLAFGRGYWAF